MATVLRRLLIIAVWAFFAAALVRGGSPRDGETLSFGDIASGIWGFDTTDAGCDDKPHRIVFSEDELRMTLTYTTAKGNNTPDETGNRLVLRPKSTDPDAIATISEQRENSKGKMREGRKIRFSTQPERE